MLLAVLLALSPGGILLEEKEEPQPVHIPTNWKQGDRYRIEKVSERVKTGGAAETRTKASSTIDVVVEERNEKGFVISWSYGEPRLDGVELTEAERKGLSLLTSPRVRFQTDASGSPERILNEKEVMDYWRRIKALVIDSKKKDLTEASRALLDETLSREFGAQVMLGEPQEFYAMCGATLRVGKAMVAEFALPFPLGDEPIPGKERVVLQDVDEEKREAHLEWSRTVDRERVLPILKRAVERAAKAAGKPPPAGEDESAIKIELSGKFSIDTRTGLPRSVTIVKTTQSQVDTTTYRVLPPAKS